jgi:hypothetical protein
MLPGHPGRIPQLIAYCAVQALKAGSLETRNIRYTFDIARETDLEKTTSDHHP